MKGDVVLIPTLPPTKRKSLVLNPIGLGASELAEGLNRDIHTLTNFEYVLPKPKK